MIFFPVYWRALTKTFLKLFAICTLCSFTLGLVIYNGQFASFIAAGASTKQVLTLAACSLFRVFSLIIGLATLFSAFLTTYQLSCTAEIISLRTAGMSLSKILAPLYYATAFITLGNFISTNLLAPYLRRIESTVIAENKTINPLILLRKEALFQKQKSHIEMDLTDGATTAKEVLIAFQDPERKTLSILTADKLTYHPDCITGENGSLITHMPNQKEDFNHLVITNQKKFSTSFHLIPSLFTSKSKRKEISIKATPTADLFYSQTFATQKELLERLSTSLIPISFSFLGMSLGLLHPRQLEERRWYLLIGFIIVFFGAFFQAQNLKSSLPLITCLFFFPHLLFLASSLLVQRIYQEGKT